MIGRLLIISGVISLLVFLIIILQKQNKKEEIPVSPNDIEEFATIENLTFQEAINLLSSPTIEENYNSLNDSLFLTEQLLLTFKNISSNLTRIPNINFTLPAFLINTTNSSFKIAKSDFEFYISVYEIIINKTNNITDLLSELIKRYFELLNDIKENLLKFKKDYEILIKNLSFPLLLNEQLIKYNTTHRNETKEYKEHKRNIRRLDNLKKDYTDSINEFGGILKCVLDFPVWVFTNIGNNLKKYVDPLKLLLEDCFGALSIQNDVFSFTTPSNLYPSAFSSKQNSKALESSMRDYFNRLDSKPWENIINDKAFDTKECQKSIDDAIQKIISNSKSLGENFLNAINDFHLPSIELPEINFPTFDFPLLDKAKNLVQDVFDTLKIIDTDLETNNLLISIDKRTSLDLLLIMDVTGSMGSFLTKAKDNLIDIIERIMSKYPGISINLGFIGYRDVEEYSNGEYTDIDFTQNYTNLQEIIEDIYAYGGGTDSSEDVAGAFELALNKAWKSNARSAILVADAPCHGKNYHNNLDDNYPNEVPGRKSITDVVEELANNNINLSCMKITEYTEKMFEMFKNIYKNHKNTDFNVKDMDSSEQKFVDFIVEYASKAYEEHRLG